MMNKPKLLRKKYLNYTLHSLQNIMHEPLQYKNQADEEKFISALCKAGLPE